MPVLAHLSDLHVTPVLPPWRLPGAFLGKRGLGYLSWRMRRRREHRPEILEALVRDLEETRPDQLVVTGDLTNLGLEQELPFAAEWLTRLGDPERVTIVPGNHDAYVKLPAGSLWRHWGPYMMSDSEAQPAADADPRAGFPTLRVRGSLALIGLCSAHPTGWFDASGTLGVPQLAALEKLLAEAGGRGLVRVLAIHHPPDALETLARRRLRDGEALRRILARVGAELVLHGHAHRSLTRTLPGPTGPIPVLGVPSSSARGMRPGRRAHYHLIEISGQGNAARFGLRARGFEPDGSVFVEGPTPAL